MGHPTKPSFYVGCMNAMSTFSHVLMGAAAILAFALVEESNPSVYNAHVYITVIGVTLLCSQAILSVNPHVGFQDNFMYPQKSKLYWIIQIIGCTLTLVGAWLGIAAMPGRIAPGLIYYPHGMVGFVASILTAVTLVGAITNLLLEEKLTSSTKSLYVIVGTLTIIMTYVAMVLQFDRAARNAVIYRSGTVAITVGLVFAILPFVALVVMTGARVVVTGSIKS
ncbi:unnamed protein product [Spodoptera littoralis]|uniref:Cytochrome b561 domain-containing protein n=1 Tax=Spodoptera littoralis TaxID=7109 RepID=A0A9P0N2Q1_SPOLI|nr:unnamed protein product [Spodoptera littoralis]